MIKIKNIKIVYSKNQSKYYENIYKKLHSFGFKTEQSEYQMKITPEFMNDRGKYERSNIRIEINNLSDIQSFCKTDNLPPLKM